MKSTRCDEVESPDQGATGSDERDKILLARGALHLLVETGLFGPLLERAANDLDELFHRWENASPNGNS